jgi:hypothetical protein
VSDSTSGRPIDPEMYHSVFLKGPCLWIHSLTTLLIQRWASGVSTLGLPFSLIGPSPARLRLDGADLTQKSSGEPSIAEDVWCEMSEPVSEKSDLLAGAGEIFGIGMRQ